MDYICWVISYLLKSFQEMLFMTGRLKSMDEIYENMIKIYIRIYDKI